MDKEDFKSFVEGSMPTDSDSYSTLKTKGFIHGEIELEDALRTLRKRYAFLQDGPERHTLGLTSANGTNNMALEVGERAIDMAFISTAQRLEFVFVGGEGNFNVEVLKGLVDFANNKNRLARKDVTFLVRGDLSGLEDAEVTWLIDQDVQFEADADTATLNGETTGLSKAVAGINDVLETKGADSRVTVRISPTEANMALGGKVVDTIAGLGSRGFSVLTAPDGGSSPNSEQFAAFYAEVLGRTLSLDNALAESTAAEFLTRIVSGCEAKSTDTRSPGSDGIGELAYDWQGIVSSNRWLVGRRRELAVDVTRDGYHDL